MLNVDAFRLALMFIVVVATAGIVPPRGTVILPTAEFGFTVPFTALHPWTFSPVAVTRFPLVST